MATENYALLIGVEDYSILDRSEGRAAGASNVAGAAEDARVWLRQCRAWGYEASHIRLCTSPLSNGSHMGIDGAGVRTSDASRASLESGLNWLSNALSRNPMSSGLITFSGHGEQGRGIVLCPADTSSTEQNLLYLPEIRNLIGGGPTVGSVTIVLDCCREGAVVKQRNAIRPRLRRWGRRFGMGMARGPGDARVIAACEPNSTAVSSTFGGQTMGAFTWALTSVLGQWQTIEKDNVTRLDASYGEVLHRTRMLLQALSFDQIPVLQGAPAIDGLPFLEPTGQRVRGRTVSEPTCRRRRRQLDPSELDFRTYLLRYTDPSGVASPCGYHCCHLHRWNR
ncbi:MAG: caspase family protein [Polyangiaceae bacterium]|nr:caspase family protein [Polyangiaceae bacterium]